MINKDTSIFCSFSSNPGNNGCRYFNGKFKLLGTNAIYKSFYSDDIGKSVDAVRTLGIKGFAVSMPFKQEIFKYLDDWSQDALDIGAVNTVVNKDGKLTGYNTDWIAVKNYLGNSVVKKSIKDNTLYIIGDGGFSKAVQYACKHLSIDYKIRTRKHWELIKYIEGTSINCTPVEVLTNGRVIDARPNEDEGKLIAEMQAKEQFKIYDQAHGLS